MIASVSIFYLYGFLILLGFGLGVIAGVRVAPATKDIEVTLHKLKQKLRGRDNTITDGIDISDVLDIFDEPLESKKLIRKERRLARKAKKIKK